MAYLQVWVHPDHRRLGVGIALVDEVEARSRERGRTLLHTQLRTGAGLEANRRFAEQRGYRCDLVEVERRLPLPVDDARLATLADDAAPHHEGYDVRVALGEFPPELRASYVALRNLLSAEAPSGKTPLEEAGETLEDFVDNERRMQSAGRIHVTGYALHGETVVAYAEAAVPTTGTHHVDQWGTLVHPAHRGHRLGMAVKCAQLRTLSAHFPDQTYVGTTNAEINSHMVAINAALGFEVHQVWGEFEKRLDAPAAQDPEIG
ncbi:MAG: GNAT family N-acetyltransferase [Nocardioides sp.]